MSYYRDVHTGRNFLTVLGVILGLIIFVVVPTVVRTIIIVGIAFMLFRAFNAEPENITFVPPKPRLTRLQKLGFSSYEGYLRSDHWKNFKEQFFASERINRLKTIYGRLVCESCRGVGILDVHHKSYKWLGYERFEDVELLCDRCHSARHRIFKNPRA
jgi:hypothetical protein